MDRAGVRTVGLCGLALRTSLISGFIAKESVVSTLQILLGGAALSTMFTGRSVISFLVFTLLYTPCIAAEPRFDENSAQPEDSWGRDDAVLRGMDRGSCCLYLGGDPVMHR